MTGRDDDKPAIGDSTEVVTYEEAARRKPSTAPARLGRYKLDRVIAQGGMAEIWLASVEGPGRFSKKVVLKRIRPSLVKQATDQRGGAQHEGGQGNRNVEMFVREARLLASLEHRNIVQVIELGVEPAPDSQRGTPGRLPEHYIVMEHLEGLTLRDLALRVWQAKRPLPLELVLRSVADACLGLEHAHKLVDDKGQPANLVHRDISPDNLFLTNAGVTKLLDFGIAKREDWSNLTQAGELKGKVPYMAPEQLKGERVDGRTDIFAVGVVLYWLLTGRRPFDGPSDIFTMKAILDDAPRPLRELNPQVPAMLEEVVLACLEKDRDRRISSAAVLHDSLAMLLMGASGAPPSGQDVVAAALALPPSSFELVPDVAAVPVMRWGGPPTQGVSSSSSTPARPSITTSITASRAASPIPDARDVSQQRTLEMALDGRMAAIAVGPARVATVVKEASPPLQTVLGAGDDAETLHEIPAADVPTSVPLARAVVPLTDPLSQQPLPDAGGAGDTGDARAGRDTAERAAARSVGVDDETAQGPALLRAVPVSADAATVQRPAAALPAVVPPAKRRSWKDDVPAELRDTVDLGLDPSAAPVVQPPVSSVSRAPAPFAPSMPQPFGANVPPPVRGESSWLGVVAVGAGVVVALVVLVGVAIAVGALPNPLASRAAPVADAGPRAVRAVVVDAGSVASLPVVAPAVVVDAGAAPADAGLALVDGGAVAVAEVDAAAIADAAIVADAGNAGSVDDELPEGKEPNPAGKKPKKRVRPVSGKPVVAAVGEGSLLVRVRPWARVSVDGVVIGTTPLPVLPLSAGRHKLRLEHETIEKTRNVDIKAGQTTTVHIDMRAP